MLHIILRSLLFISIIAFNPINLFGQDATLKKIDEATKAQLTVAGFCLCDTKLSDLKTLSDDFAETVVEEWTFPKTVTGKTAVLPVGKAFIMKQTSFVGRFTTLKRP